MVDVLPLLSMSLTSPEVTVPDAITVKTVSTFAASAGNDAATAALADELGVPASSLQTGGRLDPAKAAATAIRLETANAGPEVAIVGDVAAALLQNGGEPDWRALVGETAGIAAAAVCVATGVGAAVAPICGLIGGELGPALYDLGRTFLSDAGLIHLPPPAPPAFSIVDLQAAYEDTGAWFLANVKPYMTNLLALRQLTLTTCAVADQLAHLYTHANGGQNITWLQAFQKLQSFGLALPAQAFQTIGFETLLDAKRLGAEGAPSYGTPVQYATVEEWYLAHYVHGQLLRRDDQIYDQPSWWDQTDTLRTLRPHLAGPGDHHTTFIFSANVVLDQYGTAHLSGPQRGRLTWIYDPESLFLQDESQSPLVPFFLTTLPALYQTTPLDSGLTPAAYARQQIAALPPAKRPSEKYAVVDANGLVLPTAVVNGYVTTDVFSFTEMPQAGQDGRESLKSIASRFPAVNEEVADYFGVGNFNARPVPAPWTPLTSPALIPLPAMHTWGFGEPPTHPFSASIWLNSSTFMQVYYGQGYRARIDRIADFDALKVRIGTSLEAAFAACRRDLRRMAKNVLAGKPADFENKTGQLLAFSHQFSRLLGLTPPSSEALLSPGLLKMLSSKNALTAGDLGQHRAATTSSLTPVLWLGGAAIAAWVGYRAFHPPGHPHPTARPSTKKRARR